MKEQNKSPGENPNEMDISNIPDKEFKATVLKMLSKLSRMEQHSVNFNKALEKKKKNQSELKNTITEMKNILPKSQSNLEKGQSCRYQAP